MGIVAILVAKQAESRSILSLPDLGTSLWKNRFNDFGSMHDDMCVPVTRETDLVQYISAIVQSKQQRITSVFGVGTPIQALERCYGTLARIDVRHAHDHVPR